METAMPHASSASDIITLSTEIQSAVGENLHSSNTHPLNRTTSAPSGGAEGHLLGKNQENKSDYNEKETNKLKKLIKDDLQFIDDASKNLEKYKAEVKKQLEDAEKLLQGDTDTEKMEPEEFSKDQLFELRKHVMKLKTEIPSKVKVRYSETTAEDAKRKEKPIRQLIMREKKEHLAEVPSFYKKNKFESDEIYKEFEGGAVIVMTRSEQLAKKMVGKENVHPLLPLKDKKSCQEIFSHSAGGQVMQLLKDETLKTIVSKSGGLPWAAKMMGQIMKEEELAKRQQTQQH